MTQLVNVCSTSSRHQRLPVQHRRADATPTSRHGPSRTRACAAVSRCTAWAATCSTAARAPHHPVASERASVETRRCAVAPRAAQHELRQRQPARPCSMRSRPPTLTGRANNNTADNVCAPRPPCRRFAVISAARTRRARRETLDVARQYRLVAFFVHSLHARDTVSETRLRLSSVHATLPTP